jgi:hypothetical protein
MLSVSKEIYTLVEEKCGRRTASALLWAVVLATFSAAIGAVTWVGYNAYVYVGGPVWTVVKQWQPQAPPGLQVVLSVAISLGTVVGASLLTRWWLGRFARRLGPLLDQHLGQLHDRIIRAEARSAEVASTNAALRALGERVVRLEIHSPSGPKGERDILIAMLGPAATAVDSVDTVVAREVQADSDRT